MMNNWMTILQIIGKKALTGAWEIN